MEGVPPPVFCGEHVWKRPLSLSLVASRSDCKNAGDLLGWGKRSAGNCFVLRETLVQRLPKIINKTVVVLHKTVVVLHKTVVVLLSGGPYLRGSSACVPASVRSSCVCVCLLRQTGLVFQSPDLFFLLFSFH